MYSILRKYFLITLGLLPTLLFGQIEQIPPMEKVKMPHNLHIGANIGGAEALYYGIQLKYGIPLMKTRHHLTALFSLTSYFNLRGEATEGSYLKNDVDMRLIPAMGLGYVLTFKKVRLMFEVPVGTSIAITKGILVNDRIGFERPYSNTDMLLHFGLGFSAKYRVKPRHMLGIYGFMPILKDRAWSPPFGGIGWTLLISRYTKS